MEILYIDGKAHEYLKIGLPQDARIQKSVMDYIKLSQSQIIKEEKYGDEMIKTLTVYMPSTYIDGVRGCLIS